MADLYYPDDEVDEWDDEVEPAPASTAADPTPTLVLMMERMANMNAAQLDKLAAVLQTIRDTQQPAPQVEVQVPGPKPCRLTVQRDSKGFIESIDVEPK